MYKHNVQTDIMEGSMSECVTMGYVCNYKSHSGNLNILQQFILLTIPCEIPIVYFGRLGSF